MTSASKPSPAEKANQRGSLHPGWAAAPASAGDCASAGSGSRAGAVVAPRTLAVPSEMRRVRPARSESRTSRVAVSGSPARPSARENTLVDPPGTTASGGTCSPGPSCCRPLTTSLTVPSPPRASTTSTPSTHALRASSLPWPRWVVSASSTCSSPARVVSTRSRTPRLVVVAAGLATTSARMAVRLASDAARPGAGVARARERARGVLWDASRGCTGAYPAGRDRAVRSQAVAGPPAGGTAARRRGRAGGAAPGAGTTGGPDGGAPGGAGRRRGGRGAGRGRPVAARPHVHLDRRQRRAGPGRGGLRRHLRGRVGRGRRGAVAGVAVVARAGRLPAAAAGPVRLLLGVRVGWRVGRRPAAGAGGDRAVPAGHPGGPARVRGPLTKDPASPIPRSRIPSSGSPPAPSRAPPRAERGVGRTWSFHGEGDGVLLLQDGLVRRTGSREVYRNPWIRVREDAVERADA